MTNNQPFYIVTSMEHSNVDTLCSERGLCSSEETARAHNLSYAREKMSALIRECIHLDNPHAILNVDIHKVPVIPYEALHNSTNTMSTTPLPKQLVLTLNTYAVKNFALLYGNTEGTSIHVVRIHFAQKCWWRGGGAFHMIEPIYMFMVRDITLSSPLPESPPLLMSPPQLDYSSPQSRHRTLKPVKPLQNNDAYRAWSNKKSSVIKELREKLKPQLEKAQTLLSKSLLAFE